MAARRGKSQARRNTGNSAGMPGWAWLVLGVVLTIAVVLAAPKFMKSSDGDGFFRPKPNPDAKPAAATASDDDSVAGDDGTATKPAPPAKPKPTQYDFYTMLPGDEVQMSDAELAATEREEAARKAKAQPSAAMPPTPAGAVPAVAGGDAASVPATAAGSAAPPPAAHAIADAPYLLQAGAFGASGDAEATKAKVALLGLGARVESATINGKTVYRVRMGPYATASELAEAKRKLADGGLPAMAIKVKQ